jgi:hypothetical protein
MDDDLRAERDDAAHGEDITVDLPRDVQRASDQGDIALDSRPGFQRRGAPDHDQVAGEDVPAEERVRASDNDPAIGRACRKRGRRQGEGEQQDEGDGNLDGFHRRPP